MKQDRGTSRGPRATQVLLSVLAAVALVALGSVIPVSAASAEADSEETAAAWPARWTEYTQVDGTPIVDVDGDVTPSSVDLVTGACGTCTGPTGSVAWASDGSNAFFRIRLGTDLSDTAEGASLDEAHVVQIADGSGAVRAVVGVHRTGANQTVYVSDAVGDVVMQAHQSSPVVAQPEPLGVRVVGADDGSGRFFLDFQVPLSLIATASGGAVTGATPIKLYYGSSATANSTTKDLASITGDFMLGNVSAVDFSTLATVTLAAPQHQVTFDSAGGTDTAFKTVAEGFAAQAPTSPTRPGHEFTGWFAAAVGGPAYDFSAPVVAATTVYAQWEPHSFVVTFDSTGGSAVADQTVRYGDTVAAAVGPTRGDDTFLGWFTATTGGTSLDAQTLPVTEPMALYAHWQVAETREEPDSPPESPVPPAVDDAPAAPPAPWRVADTREERVSLPESPVPPAVDDAPATPPVQAGSTPSPVDTAAKGDSIKDLPAPPRSGADAPRERSSTATHPVVFYPNRGSAVDSQTVAAGDTAVVPAEPTRSGYAFAGWFNDADGDEEWDVSVPINEATTVYAHWTVDAGATPDEPADGAAPLDGDTDCPDYATSAEATAAMGPGDPDRLDADNDGIACDSLPAGVSGDTTDDAGQEGEHGGGAALPNTGNQVPQALVPAAALLLLLGFVLMTWDRRRAEGAPGSA